MSYINKITNIPVVKGLAHVSTRSCSAKALHGAGSAVLRKHMSFLPPAAFHMSCQYSTLNRARPSQNFRNHPTITFHNVFLSSALSTNSKEENFQVVFNNPINNTTSTSEINFNSPESIEKVFSPEMEKITDSAVEITDVPLQDLSPIVDALEPTLASLGIASNWTPVGWIQQFLEYLHVTMHMPWWMAIISCTVVARVLLLPVLIKTQKNAVMMQNYMPQMQYLQMKFGEARRAGNTMEANRYASEMMFYMKEHNVNPVKNMMIPMLQAPVFLSFFLALRSMAKLPVESFKTGGLSWTADLTIPDPYYMLPLLACSTLYVVIKIGADSGVKLDNMKTMKYVMQAMPVIAFPFCMNFASAVLYYWCATNLCTLLFVSILKIQPLREFLKMPKPKPLDPKYAPPKKGFVQGIKDSYEDQKVLGIVEDRKRMDAVRFQKAGTGPIPRTYSYDPTKPRPANAAAAASRKTQT